MEAHPLLETNSPTVDEPVAEVAEEVVTEAPVESDSAAEATVAKDPLTFVTEQFISATGERAGQLDWHLAEQIVGRADGIPAPVGTGIKNAATSAASE